jgi:hypothetical protein
MSFYEAAQAHQQFLSFSFTVPIFLTPTFIIAPGSISTESISTIKTAAFAGLAPARTVTDAVMASVQINSPKAVTGDELEPIMDAPVFPQPMYEPLRDLSQDFIFSGLDKVPPNTVQLLQTNAKFIESFLVGLNNEMGPRTVVAGLSHDQRGTYFRQFLGYADSAENRSATSLPINEWEKRELGTTAVGAGGDKLVLLIRGELLRRYPNTVIYAVRAAETDDGRDLSTNPDDERHPVFRGTLQPDVTFRWFRSERPMMSSPAPVGSLCCNNNRPSRGSALTKRLTSKAKPTSPNWPPGTISTGRIWRPTKRR